MTAVRKGILTARCERTGVVVDDDLFQIMQGELDGNLMNRSDDNG